MGKESEPTWCDVDLDGDLDLVLVSDSPGRGTFLYMNEASVFADVTYLSGAALSGALGCAFADFDRDGDQDLLFTTRRGITLLRNESRGKWLSISVMGNGVTTNADCLGCEIEVESNDTRQIRVIAHKKSTLNRSSLTQVFGFDETVDVATIRVRFTDGEIMEIPGVAPNQHVVIHQ